jgi:hypothetical protein
MDGYVSIERAKNVCGVVMIAPLRYSTGYGSEKEIRAGKERGQRTYECLNPDQWR